MSDGLVARARSRNRSMCVLDQRPLSLALLVRLYFLPRALAPGLPALWRAGIISDYNTAVCQPKIGWLNGQWKIQGT